MLHERLALAVPAAVHDLAVDHVPHGDPASKVGRPCAVRREMDGAVEGDPGHQSSVGEVLPPAAGLPDPVVRLVPVVAQPVDDLGEVGPQLVSERDAVLVTEAHGVKRLAVDVELELCRGAVADAHGARPAPTFEVVELFLVDLGRPVDAVHDLQRRTGAIRRPVSDALAEPSEEAFGLFGVAETEQRIDR